MNGEGSSSGINGHQNLTRPLTRGLAVSKKWATVFTALDLEMDRYQDNDH